MVGLERFSARKDFKEPVDCLSAKKTFFALANPLRGFVDDRLVETPGKKVLLSEVWDQLELWCAYNHVPRACSRNLLKSSLEAMGLVVTKSNGLSVLWNWAISTAQPSV